MVIVDKSMIGGINDNLEPEPFMINHNISHGCLSFLKSELPRVAHGSDIFRTLPTFSLSCPPVLR